MSLRTRIPLTSSDIEDAYEDERWLGWGYEQLFAWLNSRPGRHFADGPFTPGARSCLMLVRDGD